MQPSERDAAYIWDIRRAARDIHRFVEGRTFDEFVSQRQIRLAVERAFEIIGEAARRLSPEFVQAYREIPWRSMVGRRNVLAHQYGNVKVELLWSAASDDLPKILAKIEAIPGVPEQ